MRSQFFVRLLAVVLVVAGLVPVAPAAEAQTTMRVGVVVDLGNGTVKNVPVTMSGTEATGIQVLTAAGLEPVLRDYTGNGGAVCALKIDTVIRGCPTGPQCLTCDAPRYWGYYRAADGAASYTYSPAGAGSTKVHDGDIEAWRWGTGSPAPPFVAFTEFFPAAPPPTNPPATSPPVTNSPATNPPATSAPPATSSASATPGGTTSAPRGTVTPTSKPAAVAPGTPTSIASPTTTVVGAVPTETAASSTTRRDTIDNPSDDESTIDAENATASGPPVVEPDDGASGATLVILFVVIAVLGGAAITIHLRRRRAQPG